MSIANLENSSTQTMASRSQATQCHGSSSSGDDAHPTDRPESMRKWIIRMINSGRFPGLEWLNEEKDIFRVPWIHAKKRGYCSKRDTAMFREWAIHSGKYREDGDPTLWKINFRCAINGLKDIMEIKDMQQEDCRVYKVLPSRGRGRIAYRRRAHQHRRVSHGLRYPINNEMDPLSVQPSMSLPYSPSTTSAATYSSSSSLKDNGHESSMFYTNVPVPDTLLSEQHSPIPQNSPVVAQQHSPQQESPVDTNYQPIPASVSSHAGPTFIAVADTNPSSSFMPGSSPPSANEVQIRVFYGTIPVLSKTIDCSNGCRIYANDDPSHIHKEDTGMITRCSSTPPKGHSILCLPSNHAHTSASEIFDAMKRGVLIESQNGNVYVTPLCRTVVYCGNSSSSTPVPLEKDKCTKVFGYNSHFRPALERYALIRGESPSPYFILSLGQMWGSGRHMTENLVSIIITNSQAKHELETIGFTHLLTTDLLINTPDQADMAAR